MHRAPQIVVLGLEFYRFNLDMLDFAWGSQSIRKCSSFFNIVYNISFLLLLLLLFLLLLACLLLLSFVFLPAILNPTPG